MRSRSITQDSEILEIIRRCQWCHIAMVDTDGQPYVIPMNFGFLDNIIYMHGAQLGKKISILRQNPHVCVNFSTDHSLRYQNESVACSWSMKYRSVLAYGLAEFISDPDKKTEALHIIMKHYSDKAFKFNPPSIREVSVWKIRIDKIEGRAFGY
jgi:nitroimidazol reductase NimA-like FMN-containing flavoprotein (pyridoxamine 5'-phosphate oxidase superfamily)